MRTREATIQRKLIEEIERHGAAVCKLQAVGRRGWPDVLAVVNGRVWFIETKTNTGRLSAVQKQVHALLRANGGNVVVVDDCIAYKWFI